MAILSSFVNDIFERIATQASKLASYSKTSIICLKIQTFLTSCPSTRCTYPRVLLGTHDLAVLLHPFVLCYLLNSYLSYNVMYF
ncbi:hypothetical protein FRC06_002756 [Ceratobasidium sp. 370]|nr:hypothetical protein FRC06_002756 [Ceratobasidium sp. 370]